MSTIAKDLARKLQQDIGAAMERNLRVARLMVEPAELAIMLIEAAVSTALTAAGTVAANCEEDGKRGQMFDFTLESIARMAKLDREPSLKKVAEAIAATPGGG
jgi:hypothetical protein